MLDPGLANILMSAALAVAGAAISWCLRLNNSHVRIETRVDVIEKTTDRNAALCTQHTTQLATTDLTLAQIARNQALADEHHREVTARLDVLPRLETVMENVADAFKDLRSAVVPRPEIEERFAAAGRLMEQVGINVAQIKANQKGTS